MAKNKKNFNWKLAGILLLNFVVFYFIYQIFVYFELIIGMWIFLITGCTLFLAYFFVCRGFSPKITPNEELPQEWSATEKCAFHESELRRAKIARRIMLFLLPIILVFMVDLTILYFPDIVKMLSGSKS